MKITRITVKSEDWAIEIKGRIIPMVVVKNILMTIMLFLIAALAYNTGEWANTQTLKYFENVTTPQCSPNGCVSCHLVQQGNQVIPVCDTR